VIYNKSLTPILSAVLALALYLVYIMTRLEVWTTDSLAKNFFPLSSDLIKFYADNLRGSLFTGFLGLGGFLMSLKTFIIVNMKKEVYETDKYKEKWVDSIKNSGFEKVGNRYKPLRHLSEQIYWTIFSCISAAIAQLTIGLISNIIPVLICLALVFNAIVFLISTLRLIRGNLVTMFNHLDEVNKPTEEMLSKDYIKEKN